MIAGCSLEPTVAFSPQRIQKHRRLHKKKNKKKNWMQFQKSMLVEILKATTKRQRLRKETETVVVVMRT